MKHTPGPWNIHDEGYTFPLEIFPAVGGTRIASVTKAANGQTGITPEVGSANATLIAAAPEMLEAIRAYIEERSGDADELMRAVWTKIENC